MAVFKSIVFDLDGTLIDSAPEVRAAANKILAEEGRRALSLDEVKSLVGEGAAATIEKALKLTGDAGTPEQVKDFMRRYLRQYAANPAENTVIYPGVVETLETLQAQGVTMGICTNKPKATTIPVLEALGLDRFFRSVICADDAPHRKPDGRHVTQTLEKMGVTVKSAAFVGDSETDIAAARDAGVVSVAVSYGYCHIPLAELPADAVIDHFPDLLQALNGLSS